MITPEHARKVAEEMELPARTPGITLVEYAREAIAAALGKQEEHFESEKLRILRGNFGQICSYCGWETAASGGSWEDLQAHVKQCKAHPVFQLTEKLAALESTHPSQQAAQPAKQLVERIEEAKIKLAKALQDAVLDIDKPEKQFVGPFTGAIGFHDGVYVAIEDSNSQRVANIYDITSAAELIQALNLGLPVAQPAPQAQPVKQEPLTEEQIDKACESINSEYEDHQLKSLIRFTRAVEAAHGIKGEAS
jgi:hypothetical protein